MNLYRFGRRSPAATLAIIAALLGGAASGALGLCGPFVDTANDSFCPFVLEIFTLGITTGTSPTTYSPGDNVSRIQMAAFLSRTVDRVLQRNNRRTKLLQYGTTAATSSLKLTTLGSSPQFVKSDGTDLWVSDSGDNTVFRVRGSDGRLLETWTGAVNAFGVLVAAGRVFAAGDILAAGRLYAIDPSQAAGAVTTVSTELGSLTLTLAFDGSKIWSANAGGSISIVTPGSAPPWTTTTVTAGFTTPLGILYDGTNIWVTDSGPDTLLKLDSNGAILQTVTVGTNPQYAVFDGNNIWVPNVNNSVSVVRASTGAVLATLTGNGLSVPHAAAFDGERVLITSDTNAVSLWKAADLTPLGFVSTGAGTVPNGACSDGIHFWVVLNFADKLARF